MSQKIDFRPPRQMPPAIARLRGDFIFRAEDGPGPHRPIDVSLASPDFIALRDVPPLFVRHSAACRRRRLLRASRHRPARTTRRAAHQLVRAAAPRAERRQSPSSWPRTCSCRATSSSDASCRNWRSRSCLESALGKDRILEIYLNIIEWGPDLRGLRPAARRYFGREPRELTPAEMAFLVAIIPGPIKYQSSFAHGTPGPGAAFADR